MSMKELMEGFVGICVRRPSTVSQSQSLTVSSFSCAPELEVWALISQQPIRSSYSTQTGTHKMTYRYYYQGSAIQHHCSQSAMLCLAVNDLPNTNLYLLTLHEVLSLMFVC